MANIFASIEFDAMNADDSGYTSGNSFWHMSTFLRAVKNQNCKKFKHYLASCHFASFSRPLSPLDMAIHYKRTKAADLNSPIILCPWGEIVDGTHRVTKALVEGRKWVWAYRLKSMPDPDRVKSDA